MIFLDVNPRDEVLFAFSPSLYLIRIYIDLSR
jgi:hypothetical protein